MAGRARSVISLAVLLLVLLAGCQSDREVHEDQAGPLSATSGWGSFSMDKPRGAGATWVGGFGSYTLCVRDGGTRIELQRVGWRSAQDARPLKVEPWLRFVDRTTKPTSEFVAVPGLPWKPLGDKPYPGRYSDKIAGEAVTQTCAELNRGRKADSRRRAFTELVFVMKVGEQGGELTQGYIDYLADGEPYRLIIGWKMIMCGSAVTARGEDDCGGRR